MEQVGYYLVLLPYYYQTKGTKMEYHKPRPIIDNDSKTYWESAKKNKLMIQHAKKSNEYFLYSRQLNKNIDDNDLEWIEAKGKGKIYSYTIVNTPAGPAFVDEVPYVVASIILDEGARIIGNIINSNVKNIKIGKKVKVIFDKQNEDLTIPKFVLDE